MSEYALLLSIRPKYATKIFDGSKTVELRRVRPRVISGDLVFVYASSPTKALIGAFEVEKVVAAAPAKLWNEVQKKAGLTQVEFDNYFAGAEQGYGIFLKRKWLLSKPVPLETLRKRKTKFRPPQSYQYMTLSETTEIGLAEFIKMRE